MNNSVSYLTLFKTFLKIGIVTFGGGYAMIPIIESEVVDKHHWMTKEEFLDAIATTQICPGALAINMSSLLGYKLAKTPGAIVCTLGASLPSFLIILAIAMFFHQFEDNKVVAAMFAGIRPAVVALIAVPTFSLAKSAGISLVNCWIPILSALLIWLLGVNPIWVIIAAAVIVFIQIGIFGFGGGYSMISLIQGQVVTQYHWMTMQEFTDVVAISQMTPGPIGINTATYCGYTAVHNAGMSGMMAVLGSAMATFALVLPSLVLMILISKMLYKYMNTLAVQSIFIGLRPAIVGLVGAAALLLMNGENFSTPDNPWHFYISIALFFATFIGVKVMKINPIRMILYSAFAGLVLLY